MLVNIEPLSDVKWTMYRLQWQHKKIKDLTKLPFFSLFFKLPNTQTRSFHKNIKLYFGSLIFSDLALLSVICVIDPGHDDLCQPKKASKPCLFIYKKVGNQRFTEFSLQHISSRNKSIEDNKENKWICLKSICTLLTSWKSTTSRLPMGKALVEANGV